MKRFFTIVSAGLVLAVFAMGCGSSQPKAEDQATNVQEMKAKMAAGGTTPGAPPAPTSAAKTDE